MKLSSLHCALSALLTATAYAGSTFSPVRPPAIPLAVKSPYMSSWLMAGQDNGNGGYLYDEWATFWQGQITGWTGLINVDGATFTWMGAPSNISTVNQTAFSYTATRSIFTMNVLNKVEMDITFLSSVTPDDMQRLSMPYTYMDVGVKSIDGKTHKVSIYTDISAEWVSGDHTANAQWSYGTTTLNSKKRSVPIKERMAKAGTTLEKRQNTETTYGTQTSYTGWTSAVPHNTVPTVSVSLYKPHGLYATPTITAEKAAPTKAGASGLAYHRVWREQQLVFSETNQQADWGYWYYATENNNELTYQSGEDVVVRGQFATNGYLADTQDTNYRPIDDNYPVFGFASSLGEVNSTSVSRLFSLNLCQEEAVQFESGYEVVETQYSLWTSYFSSELDAVSFFYNDYSNQQSMSTSIDNQIESDSVNAIGSNYNVLTSLVLRQVYGAIELTGNQTSVLAFLKEISSDGNVNTVDVIFPAHPLFLYSNPTILKMLLDPLFINQQAGNWPFQFSIHDIGDNFPNATGHNNGQDEQQPLEECGNMIIMTLAYAQRANDNAYLSEHYDILKQWNTYLVQEALIPQDQISTDDFAGALANQTNLAIKGIIGISAMAEIAQRTGHTHDYKNFTNIAKQYITEWQTLGIAHNANPPHSTLAYGRNSTYSLLYNLYADRELSLGLVPQSVYDMQSNFYPTVEQPFGVPLDTRHTYTKADWMVLCASIASESTRNMFINAIANWINLTPTNYAVTDLYDADDGNYPFYGTSSVIYFIARPVLGGWYAPLALPS